MNSLLGTALREPPGLFFFVFLRKHGYLPNFSRRNNPPPLLEEQWTSNDAQLSFNKLCSVLFFSFSFFFFFFCSCSERNWRLYFQRNRATEYAFPRCQANSCVQIKACSVLERQLQREKRSSIFFIACKSSLARFLRQSLRNVGGKQSESLIRNKET